MQSSPNAEKKYSSCWPVHRGGRGEGGVCEGVHGEGGPTTGFIHNFDKLTSISDCEDYVCLLRPIGQVHGQHKAQCNFK